MCALIGELTQLCVDRGIQCLSVHASRESALSLASTLGLRAQEGVEVDGVNVETAVHDAMEAGCDNGTGHVEAGHGEEADAIEAGCDNGMGHVGEGAEAGSDNGTDHVETGHGEGADTMEACCDNGTGHVETGHGEGADAMEAGSDNGAGHVENSHGEGAGGTVRKRGWKNSKGGTNKRRKAAKPIVDTQGLLNDLSEVQKLANKRLGVRTRSSRGH